MVALVSGDVKNLPTPPLFSPEMNLLDHLISLLLLLLLILSVSSKDCSSPGCFCSPPLGSPCCRQDDCDCRSCDDLIAGAPYYDTLSILLAVRSKEVLGDHTVEEDVSTVQRKRLRYSDFSYKQTLEYFFLSLSRLVSLALSPTLTPNSSGRRVSMCINNGLLLRLSSVLNRRSVVLSLMYDVLVLEIRWYE